MRILTRKKQQDAYKELVEIVKVLTKAYVAGKRIDLELQDAIASAYEVVDIVGGREMIDALEGKNYHTRPLLDKIGNSLCDGVNMLDNVMERDCE